MGISMMAEPEGWRNPVKKKESQAQVQLQTQKSVLPRDSDRPQGPLRVFFLT